MMRTLPTTMRFTLALGLGVALLTAKVPAQDNARGLRNRIQQQQKQQQQKQQQQKQQQQQQPQQQQRQQAPPQQRQQRQERPQIQQPRQSSRPQIQQQQQPRQLPRQDNRPNLGGNRGDGNRGPIINRDRGGAGNIGPGNLGRGNQTTRKIEVPQNVPNAGRNLPGNRNNPPDMNSRMLQNRNRGNNPPGAGRNPNLGGRPELKPRDNGNRPGGLNNRTPNIGDRPVLKPRGNDNRPGGGIINRNPGDRNPNVGDRPVLKPRGDDNRPGVLNRNPGNRGPNLGDRPVLKPRDNDNRPGGIINRNPGDRNPNIGDRPVLRPRDNDGRPGVVNKPNLNAGPGNRDRGGDRFRDRNNDLRQNLRKLPPIANNRRQDNERQLIRNREQALQFLDKNPNLRDRVQGPDGKIDLSRLHLERGGRDRISTIVNRNGDLRIDRDSDLAQRLRPRDRARNLDELNDRLRHFRDPDVLRRHPELSRLDFRRASGNFQLQLDNRRFDRLTSSRIGRQLDLDRQFRLHRQGDIARQLNLNVALINHGGWRNRYMGPIFGGYTTSSFSAWYSGPGYYPSYCWTPMWSPWVDWSWWDTCPIIYDPRPIYVRPIYEYDPCPVWVVYDYPVWEPLPVVASGTWVDLPSPVLVDNTDVRLIAVRFVDNGHPDQELGTRYRVWFENDSKDRITTPFNVLLLASNTPDPAADLPQAGLTIPSMEPGEMQVVDIRLPYAANRMNRVDDRSMPFNFLQVLVDSHRQLQDVRLENNGAILERTEILPVDPAAFAPDVVAAAPGAMVSLAGEGFGPEPGQLIVSLDGEQTEATVYGWYDLGVQFELPNFTINGPVEAEILVVRGDGAASNPVTVRLAPEDKLEQAALPEAPVP